MADFADVSPILITAGKNFRKEFDLLGESEKKIHVGAGKIYYHGDTVVFDWKQSKQITLMQDMKSGFDVLFTYNQEHLRKIDAQDREIIKLQVQMKRLMNERKDKNAKSTGTSSTVTPVEDPCTDSAVSAEMVGYISRSADLMRVLEGCLTGYCAAKNSRHLTNKDCTKWRKPNKPMCWTPDAGLAALLANGTSEMKLKSLINLNLICRKSGREKWSDLKTAVDAAQTALGDAKVLTEAAQKKAGRRRLIDRLNNGNASGVGRDRRDGRVRRD